MKRPFKPEDLAALNFLFQAEPTLASMADTLIDRVDRVNAALTNAQPPPKPEGPSPTDLSKTAEIQARVLAWFQTNPGKHPATAVRKALEIPEGSKPFKTAIQNLIGEKLIKFSGKVGKGAEYWLAEQK
jgi:hypothetical protein